MRSKCGALVVMMILGATLAPASIVYTCDGSVATSTCNYLNGTVAALYNNTFTDANASIYVQYGNTGLASTSAFLNAVPYSDYVAALTANGNMDALQASALANLKTTG